MGEIRLYTEPLANRFFLPVVLLEKGGDARPWTDINKVQVENAEIIIGRFVWRQRVF